MKSSKPNPLDRVAPAFLDEIVGDEALAWVREHNETTEQVLGDPDSNPTVQQLEEQILAILDSPDRIPLVTVRGQWAYNFWTDTQNPRGLWRRQKFADYLNQDDTWDVLLDVDALSEDEGKSWVWHGASLCPEDYDRALITLSNGGTDADETREFDVATRTWVEDGFYRPEARGSLRWLKRDTCWLTQPTSAEDTSASGYPLRAHLWRRGEPLEAAELIFSADSEAMGVWVATVRDRSGTRSFIDVREDFYRSDQYLITDPAASISPASPKLLPLPSSADATVWNEWTVVWLRDEWQRPEGVHRAGSLLSFETAALLANPDDAVATTIFSPTEREVLEGLTFTRNHLVVTTIKDVVSRLMLCTPATNGTWVTRTLPVPRSANAGEKEIVTVATSALDPVESDELWMVTTGYTRPSTLWLTQSSDRPGDVLQVRQAPHLYDDQHVVATQHFATSADGTRVPYFEVRSQNAKMPAPTLLYGYGGFNVSLLPSYIPVVGRVWLEAGGVYVVANIRGGGEYGPQWHQAALKENRHRAYEDFIAVARDLVRRGVTTREQLGIQGGSNGGLLVGNMYTQFPEEFGAVLCQVPLLDMGRYHTLLAGHSWMAEYGNPESEEDWEYIHGFSPVHQFSPTTKYPSLMLTTSTKDDRVHPAHARILAYLAQRADKSVLYFENIEGGHAGAADNLQRAHNQALGWSFLWRELTRREA